MTPEETEAVLAHELGHYKLHHIYKMMAFSFIFSLLFFWILSVLAECSWFYEGLGVNLSHGASHGVALILFSVAVPVFLFPLAPLALIFILTDLLGCVNRVLSLMDEKLTFKLN